MTLTTKPLAIDLFCGLGGWSDGSFYLWGDVPALMPMTFKGEGRKGKGSGAIWFDQNASSLPSNSIRRKQASAMIAKIPLPISTHIARVFRP
jgi:hypothetical protein